MNSFLALRLFYLFYFGAIGILIPYFPVWLKSQGFGPFEIGLVMAAWPLAKLVTPVFWSNLADRLHKRVLFIRIGVVMAALLPILFFFSKTVWALLAVMFGFSFFRMGILPMVEAFSMEYCVRHHKEYGHIRYWGSLGAIGGAFLFGWLIDRYAVGIILPGLLGVLFLQMLAGFCLPTEQPRFEKAEYSLKIFMNREVLSFLMVMLLRTISFGAYYTFFSLWLESLGFSSTVIGVAWALASLSEIVSMIGFGRLHRHFTLRDIMGIGVLLTVARWLLLGVTGWLPAVLLAQTLQAFTFATFHIASVAYMYQHTPHHLRSTGQAVYSSVSYGLGSAISFFMFGWLKTFMGYESLFLICAGIAALAIPFLQWFREKAGAEVPVAGMD